MASIDVVERDRKGRPTKYRARWRTPDGESRSKNFAKKVDAENHLTAISHSQLVGTYVDPRLGKTRFSDVVATYLERGAA